MRNIKIVLYVIIAIALIWVFLWQANRRTESLLSVGNCVEQKVQEDGFAGPVDQAWETYAEICASEK